MSTPEFLVIAGVVLIGAFLQGASGFGLGMFAAPVVALVDPTLMPALLILLATVLTAILALRERAAVNRAGVGWSLLGRLPGSAIGAGLVALLSPHVLALLVGLVVLGGAGLSVRGWVPKVNRRTLMVAGMAAGVTGTSTSIGGPPMALLFQRSDPAETRGTLSVFFLVGSLISLGLLLLAGAVDLRVVTVSAWLLPALLAGYGISRLLVPYVNRNRMRVLAITMSCLSATVLLGQQLWRLLG